MHEIAKAAAVRPGEMTELKRVLRELVRAGSVEREGRRYRVLPNGEAAPSREGGRERGAAFVTEEPRRRGRGARRGAPEEVVGVVTVRPEGYGFLHRTEGPAGEDVFLPPSALEKVMDGDSIRARIVPGRYGRDVGELVEVLSHRRRHLLGIYRLRGRGAFVEPLDPRLPLRVRVKPHPEALEYQVVKVEITRYAETGSLQGEVERILSPGEDPLADALEVAYRNGFSDTFPPEVRKETESIPEVVLEEETVGRKDLRNLPLVTIDGPNAQDFDDAVFAERLPNGGYRLLVAIADVAHYVPEGSALDEEALWRGSSVYFPGMVLPMLPEALSNGICSLNPGVDRLCMVCEILFDSDGRPVESEVYEGVMRSHARCTYDQVAALLGGEEVPALAGIAEHLRTASELAEKLHARRVERGALDFDLPEAEIVLGEDLRPVSVLRRERNWAHRLIEEMMLAANEAVARGFAHRGLPVIYRVHDEPDPEKLAIFARLAEAVGFPFDTEEPVPPGRLAALLRAIEGSPQQKVLSTLLLRSLMQAIYSARNIGHYGLASEHYLHFTAPIRRYPDLVVHRLLKDQWRRAGRMPSRRTLEKRKEELEAIAAQASERERAATSAEREVDQLYKCLIVQHRVGERMDATITGVTDFGFFAELDGYLVEGLVRAEELGVAYRFDEERHRLVFGSGRAFSVGERVRVEIASVDLPKRQVNLVLVADEDGRVLPARPRRAAGSKAALMMATAWPDAQPKKRGAGAKGGGRTGAKKKSAPRTRRKGAKARSR